MRFTCPEIDRAGTIQDLYKISKVKTDILDNSLNRIFYQVENNLTSYQYARPMMFKYLSAITQSTTAMTIAEYATYAGITISDNLGATVEAMDFYFMTAELRKLKTEMFLTIFGENGIYFYKPEKLAASVKITSFNIIGRVRQENINYGFYGEAGYSLSASVLDGDTINAATIDDDLKTLIINTNKAAADVIIISTGYDAAPLDYINDPLLTGGITYLAVSKKEVNGIFQIFMVRESAGTYTFAQGDVTNPNVTSGGGTDDHAELSHLAYADSGHTGFQAALGYTAENVANKEASALDTSTTKYPNNAVVKAAVDGKMANPMSAAGDIIVGGASGTPGRLAKGDDGKYLKLVSGTPAWETVAAGMENPMTTAGDIITGGADGAPGRLAIGSEAMVNRVTSGVPAWSWIGVPRLAYCTADRSSTSRWLTNITNLSIALETFSKYQFEIVLFINVNDTAGAQFGVNVSLPGATVAGYHSGKQAVAGSLLSYYFSSLGTNLTPPAANYLTAAQTAPIIIKGYLTTAGNAGNLTAMYQKTTSGTIIALLGSYIKLIKIA